MTPSDAPNNESAASNSSASSGKQAETGDYSPENPTKVKYFSHNDFFSVFSRKKLTDPKKSNVYFFNYSKSTTKKILKHPGFSRKKSEVAAESAEPKLLIADISVTSTINNVVALVESISVHHYQRDGVDKEGEKTGEILNIHLADASGRIKAYCYKEHIEKISALVKEEKVRMIQ